MILKNISSVLVLSFLFYGCQKKHIYQAKSPSDYIIKITSGWKFIPGDDSSIANITYDDSSADTIEVGKNWLRAGFPSVLGMAWYRTSFTVPSSLRVNPYYKKGNYLKLELGQIGDADETFFNGMKY
jgi:hypothetical protein